MNDVLGKLRQRLETSSLVGTSQTFGSHDVTLEHTTGVGENLLDQKSIETKLSHDYHLTVRIDNSQLGPRELSLITEVLEYQIVHFGCNLGMYLTLSELYFRLLGQKRKALEVNNGKIRTIATIAEILLVLLGAYEFSADSNIKLVLNSELRNIIAPFLMTKRTYGSRYRSWRPERFIKIRAVPVEVIFERSSADRSKRYSGYTKGYGESHGNAHKFKTKPSAELDGDPDAVSQEERNLNLRMTDPDHQPANAVWIKLLNFFGIKL